jgi:hypothetical protein
VRSAGEAGSGIGAEAGPSRGWVLIDTRGSYREAKPPYVAHETRSMA